TYPRGLLDPLAPLTFPVLPALVDGQPLASADDPDFAKKPVGSGPYLLPRRDPKEVGEFVALEVNPFHPGSLQMPLREIRFFATGQPTPVIGDKKEPA